jgi:hypothetical protein
MKCDGTMIWQNCDGVPPLAELQKTVGGYIERLAMPEGFFGDIWVDEEGHCKEAPLNARASILMQREWERYCIAEGMDPSSALNYGMMQIVGDAIWTTPEQE